MSKTMREMLNERRESSAAKAKTILDRAESEKRELYSTEKSDFDLIMADLESLRSQTDKLDKFNHAVSENERAVAGGVRSNAHTWINTDTGQRAEVRSGESFGSHEVVQSHQGSGDESTIAQYGSLGGMLRALTTVSGTAIVPQKWSSDLIDLARNKSAVMAAGATLLPMEAKTLNIGRVTGDAQAAFRLEGGTITPSDPTFDQVTLVAKSLSAEVIATREFMQDADNSDQLILNALAQAISSKIDQVCLYGGIVAGAGTINLPTPPNPRGILASLNANLPANVLGAAANGTTQTNGSYWGEILDLLYTIKDSNEEPNAIISNSKFGRLYAKANDSTGQPLMAPADYLALARFTSNVLPSYTQGTMTGTATDVFAGDFTQLLVGQRLGFTLQVETGLYSQTGQVAIIAHWRGDVALARNGAFAVYRSLRGA